MYTPWASFPQETIYQNLGWKTSKPFAKKLTWSKSGIVQQEGWAAHLQHESWIKAWDSRIPPMMQATSE